MRIIVTGGAGFIGGHLVDGLALAGHDVHVVDNLSTGRRENVGDRAALHQLDIRDRGLAALLQEIRADALVHLAAQMDVRKSVADPVYDADVNVIGALNVLEAARLSGVRKLVYASTGGAVYGEPERIPVAEDHPLRPLSPYGASKQAFEQYLSMYEGLYGMRATTLRLSNVFGPRQDPHGEAGVVAIFSLRLLEGKACTIFGDGSKTRDYVYVADVVAAFEAALARDMGGTFNIGRGIEVSDREVYDAVRQAVGGSLEPVYADRRPGEIERIALDAGRARRELPWSPRTDFARGVELAVAHYRAHGGPR
ncbi:MAG: GDP-mannose 4,6-dehydratase [Acidobacteriota bacterium]